MYSIKILLCLIFCYLNNWTEGVLWPCKSDIECKELDTNAICLVIGSCKCPAGKTFSGVGNACVDIVQYGAKCTESAECSGATIAAACIDGTCKCQDPESRYLRGRCRKLKKLKESCDKHEDCYFGYDRESVQCSGNPKICSCAIGYYERSSKICRRQSKVGGACVVDTDCSGSSAKCQQIGFKCTSGKVQKSNDFNSTKTLEKYFRAGRNQENIKPQIVHTIDASWSKTFEIIPVEEVPKFGDKCLKNLEPCQGFENSICMENSCYCKPGYYLKNGICMAELGEIAVNKTYCATKYDSLSKKCVCEDNFFNEPDLRACKKPIQFTAGCTSDSQCSPYGANCKQITPKKCTCDEYAEYSAEKQMCVNKKGIGGPCADDKSCSIENSKCNAKQICECVENYYDNDGKCSPGIGGDCIEDSEIDDCQIENSICVISESTTEASIEGKGTCMCEEKFVHVDHTCLLKATNISQNCTHSEQCAPIAAICVNGQCACSSSKHFSFGRCEITRKLTEQCTRAGQCYMESNMKSVECRNSECQCKFGYDATDGICLKANSSNRLTGFNLLISIAILAVGRMILF